MAVLYPDGDTDTSYVIYVTIYMCYVYPPSPTRATTVHTSLIRDQSCHTFSEVV